MIKLTRNFLLLAFLPVFSSVAFSQDDDSEASQENWYQVEIVLFKNLDENTRYEEQWPTTKTLELPEDVTSLNELLSIPLSTSATAELEAIRQAELAAEQALLEQTALDEEQLTLEGAVQDDALAIDASMIPAPPIDTESTEPVLTTTELTENTTSIEDSSTAETTDALTDTVLEEEPAIITPATENQLVLSHQALQLKYNKRFAVLFHGGWHQQFNPESDLTHFRLSLENKGVDIDGIISVVRKKFLHVTTNLWMHELADAADSAITDLESNDSQPATTTNISQPMAPITEANEIENNNGSEQVIEYAHLYKKERLRSNELHYIDHPRMGMLLQITPIEEIAPAQTNAE